MFWSVLTFIFVDVIIQGTFTIHAFSWGVPTVGTRRCIPLVPFPSPVCIVWYILQSCYPLPVFITGLLGNVVLAHNYHLMFIRLRFCYYFQHLPFVFCPNIIALCFHCKLGSIELLLNYRKMWVQFRSVISILQSFVLISLKIFFVEDGKKEIASSYLQYPQNVVCPCKEVPSQPLFVAKKKNLCDFHWSVIHLNHKKKHLCDFHWSVIHLNHEISHQFHRHWKEHHIQSFVKVALHSLGTLNGLGDISLLGHLS